MTRISKKQRYTLALEWFEKAIPVPETELHFDSTFHLLVAVILSAQCTDKRVNIITPPLFEAYPTPADMAAASVEQIFEFIKSCSYPNNKAKSLLGMAKTLVEEFDSVVPDNLDDLLRIPGVGRKTANVILAVAYGKAAMAVDTHVFRVAERIGLTTDSRNPLTTELELTRNIPPELIPKAHHWLILHGRYTCKARRPDCLNCGLTAICRYFLRQNP